MKTPERSTIVHGFLVLFAFALIGKAAYEQLYRGSYWAQQGRQQHYASSELPTPRGQILDESGNVLVESRALVKVRVAPSEVRSPAILAQRLRKAGVAPNWVTAATDTKRRWVEIPMYFLPQDIAQVAAMRGVYPKALADRVYANSAGIRRIVGRVDRRSGNALDGIELSMNDVLEGDTGSVRVPRDKSGKHLDAPVGSVTPEPGRSVTLTINRGLQDICERALADAVDSLRAAGGDIVVLNPHTGAVLALASVRGGKPGFANTAITEPYEPGSTIKPFVAARLLDRKLARPDETIQTYNGEFEIDGRVIHDTHKEASLTLADVIKYSSNIGIVRFSLRLNPREKYELLRDIGFGTPTTVPLPGESSGILAPPSRWSKQTAASVVMGYEVAVTPLQLALAYGAIANGGELLEPQLVSKVQRADGTVEFEAKRRVVRRIMTPEAAAELRRMLRDVVEGGTSTRADLSTIDVAGKSGTARRTEGGRYLGDYTASFVGLFPDDRPQFVILAKLDAPKTSIYGGVAAGAVTNVVLRAALAARDAALDLHSLASSIHAPRVDSSPAARAARAESVRAAARVEAQRVAALEAQEKARRARGDTTPLPGPARSRMDVVPADTDPRTSASYVVKLPNVSRIAPVVATVRPVPDVSGLSLRRAVSVLHGAGFRVQLTGGSVVETVPAAGTPWMPGRVVKLGGGG